MGGRPADQASSSGRLEAVLRAGHFALTAETTPPDSADPAAVLARAGCLKGLADAVNVTDAPGAKAHMSALAAAAILSRAGIEPVLQLTTRDRNRLALEGDILGAAALGVPNLLCLGGDDPKAGDQPETKAVHDLSSNALVAVARQMCEEGAFPSGRRVEPAPRLFIGAADIPRAPRRGEAPERLMAKIEAGARFVQTQFCFDMGVLRAYMAWLGDHGILERVHVLLGLGPIASARAARWMLHHLPGVSIPEAQIARLEHAAEPAAEGRRVCLEAIAAARDVAGVAGVHLMGPRAEEAIAEIVAESGLLATRGTEGPGGA